MKDCLFCRIIAGEIPADTVYGDEHCLAFRDIAPQAPQHALLIPKAHAAGLNDLGQLEDAGLLACLRAVPRVAEALGISESGYRLVSNCGADACQSVRHLHFHIMGGRPLTGQMG